MRLMIPTIGATLELTHDWEFTLIQERRNHAFSKALGLEWAAYPRYNPGKGYGEPLTHLVTLPKGSRLKVARIYIRSGGADMKKFDSVTFTLNGDVPKKRGVPLLKGRFWAKLKDVNRMRCDLDPTTWPGLTDLEVLGMVAEMED